MGTMLTKEQIEKLLKENEEHQCPPEAFNGVCVRIIAIAKLPSRFGEFQIVAFYNNKERKEHVAIIHGDVLGKSEVPTRIHSECLTGDVIGSLRCDCRDQLTTSLRWIGEQDVGIVLYLRQEGRGIGLNNKIKAYALQDEGYDTIEADQKLGFSGDEREYDIAAHMLYSLEVGSVKLMTNNPRKIENLTKHGVNVVDRIPLVIPANDHNRDYLETKERKAGHILSREANERYEQKEKIIIKNGDG